MKSKLAATEAGNFLQEVVSRSRNQEELDEMLAASISAEENGMLAGKEVPSTVPNTSEEKFDTDGEMILVNFANLEDGLIRSSPYYHMTHS